MAPALCAKQLYHSGQQPWLAAFALSSALDSMSFLCWWCWCSLPLNKVVSALWPYICFPWQLWEAWRMFLLAGLLLPRDVFSRVCVYRPIPAAAGPVELTAMVYFYHRETVNSIPKPSIRTCCTSSFYLLSIKPNHVKLLLLTMIFPDSFLFLFLMSSCYHVEISS